MHGYRRVMTSPADGSGPEEPPRLRISDAGVMRALAHQARMAILEHLMTSEATTATEVAAICGLSPSATSYHLRALAKVGLVEPAPSRGDARERRWRSRIKSYEVNGGLDADQETRAAERELLDAFLIREETRTRQWLARREEAAPQWQQAAAFDEAILLLDAGELVELTERLRELIRPYGKVRRRDAPPGARTVSLQLRAFPVDEGA